MPKRSIPAKRIPLPAAGRRNKGAAKRKPDIVLDYAKQMHVPMNEAMALMQALVLIGHGMDELGRDGGSAVTSVAEAAHERLQIIDDTWIDFVQALRR